MRFTSYLEKLVLIIGMSAKRAGRAEICYVDCFAGPWGAPNDDLEGHVDLVVAEDSGRLQAEAATLGVDATMRALFVERDKGRVRSTLDLPGSKAPPTVSHACLQATSSNCAATS